MTNKTVGIAAGIVVALAVGGLVSCNLLKLDGGPGSSGGGGGGMNGPPPTAKSCPGTTCTINVSVVAGKCVPENDHVKVAPDQVITWHLTDGAAGWKFKANGVKFETHGWESTFEGGTGGGTTDFQWTVKHVQPNGKEYQYSLHIDSAGQSCTIDPSLWL